MDNDNDNNSDVVKKIKMKDGSAMVVMRPKGGDNAVHFDKVKVDELRNECKKRVFKVSCQGKPLNSAKLIVRLSVASNGQTTLVFKKRNG